MIGSLPGWIGCRQAKAAIFFPYPGVIFGKKRMDQMYVGDTVRKCVVFIGHMGVGDKFIADGTGFVILMEAYDYMMPYIVTAMHVIDQAAGEEHKKEVLIRINTVDGGFKYFETERDCWYCHPDHVPESRQLNYIDVAAYYLGSELAGHMSEYDISCVKESDICTDEIISKYSIGIGDEVVVPGLFHSHVGIRKNIPIARIGNIAAMREEPVPTSHGTMDAYLTEMRSIGGISGSPVFMHMAVRPDVIFPGAQNQKIIEKSPQAHYLLGLVHGHYTITTQDEWAFKTDQQIGDINAGIAIVVPASKIMEAICQPIAFGRQQESARLSSEHNARTLGKTDSRKTR
jgi:hypothetical protein